MVRIPEPPPKGGLDPRLFEAVLDAPDGMQVVDLVNAANRDYVYWDKFKHKKMPEGTTPEQAWRFLKVVRKLHRVYAPVVDVHGDTFWYSQTDELQRCLHVIDQQAGSHLTATTDFIPDDSQDRYLISGLMEEAIASSQIEGAATTRQMAKDMLRTGRKPADKAEQMVLNNYLTIRTASKLAKEQITPQLILQLQASMTLETLDDKDIGAFRTTDDVVVMDATLEVLHVPPPASEIQDQLERLCSYANYEGGAFVHPVIRAIVLHFWLAYLHPFVDGNGRTARALFYLYMLKHGYWLFQYLSISRVILNSRTAYEKSFLHSEIDEADCTYFLQYNLHAIEKAITELREYIAKKSEEDESLRRVLQRDFSLNHRQRAILQRAVKDPDVEFTIESHRASHGVAYATARDDLLDLESQGFLDRMRENRRFVFRPSRHLRTRVRGRDPRSSIDSCDGTASIL